MAYGGLDALGQPKNRFPGPNAYNLQDKRYYPIVSDDGIIQIYRDQSVLGLSLSNPSIGTYNTKTKQFTFTKGPDGKVSSDISKEEQQYFSSQAGRNQVQEVGAKTVSKTVVEAGGTPEQGQEAASNVTGQELPNEKVEGDPVSVADIQSGTRASETKNRLGANTYGDTHYPLNRDPKQDYIRFTMVRYSPRSLEFGSISGEKPTSGEIFGNRAKDRITLGTVTLPIQPSISDTNLVNWGESSMNAFEAAAAASSMNIITEGVAGAERSAAAAGQMLKQDSAAVKALIASSLASAAAGGGQNAAFFTRLTGGIINPNLELLFQGPLLRGFTFNFTLSAREPKEAQAIKKIIRFFKQGMSVKRTETSLFLQSPNTFNIQYIYGGNDKDHPWINKIKECALQNFSVNYTPAGNYATYLDGSMTQYDLALTFGELDPIYDEDYNEADTAVGGGQDSSIGY